MLNPFRIQQHKRGGLGQNMRGLLLQELVIGNSRHLNLMNWQLETPHSWASLGIPQKEDRGGGSTPNTRWPGRRLKIAVNKYTIGYKYTQLRIDGKRLLQVLSSYAVMRYTTMSYTSQSCNIQHPPACGGWVSRFLISEMIHNSVPSGGRDHSDGRS